MPTRVQTSIEMREIAEPYARRKALSQLEHGRVSSSLEPERAIRSSRQILRLLSELPRWTLEIILLAKNVDAVYDKDPAVHSDARKLSRLTHMEVLEKDLKVMDLTAATLCRDNHIKIHVFAIAEEGNVMRAIVGEDIGTIIE